MRLILFEGMPGTGKTTMGEKMFAEKTLPDYGAFIDEYEQDNVLFGDYWEEYNGEYKDKIRGFLRSWPLFLDKYADKDTVMTDNLLMNQIRYLYALDAPEDKISEFFRDVVILLEEIRPQMVFLDGDPSVIIPRVAVRRTNGWGARVAGLFEQFPRQKRLKATGMDGLVRFFRESRELSKALFEEWPYPVADIDVTDEMYDKSEEVVRLFMDLNS